MRANEAGGRARWTEGFFCLGIAALCLWYFRASGRYVFGDDALIHRYPFAVFIGRALAAGELPLWNPHNWSGTPFVADISADLWYPFNLLYAFLPAEAVFEGLHLFHVAAGGLAAYCCARVFGLSPWGAAVSGLVYATGPLFFHAIYNGYFILTTGLAFLPLVLGLYQLGEVRGDRRWSGAAGLALGVQGLGCHVQLWVFTVALLALKAAHAWWGGRRWSELLLPLALALGIGALIAGVKLLPFGAFAGEGLLVHGIGGQGHAPAGALRQFWEAGAASLSPFAWAQFLFPEPRAALAAPAYVGAGALVLALIGGMPFAARQNPGFFALLALGGLVLALGFYSPLQWLLYWLPGGQFLRRPERFLVFFVLGISLLAGRGVDRLCREPEVCRAGILWVWANPWVRWGAVGWGLATLAGATLVAFWGPALVGWVDGLWQRGALGFLQATAKPGTSPELMRLSLQELALRQLQGLFPLPGAKAFGLGAAALALSGLVVAGAGRGLQGRALAAAAVGLVALGAGALHGLYRPEIDYRNVPGEYYRHSGVFRQLGRDGSIFRVLCLGPDISHGIPGGVARHNQGMVAGFEEVHAFDNFVNRRYAALLNRLNGQPPEAAPRRPIDLRVRNPYSPLVDLLNVKYAVSPDSLDAAHYALLLEDEAGLRLYERRRLVPRARLVYDWREVEGLDAALAGVAAPAFDALTQAVVEGPLPPGFSPGPRPAEGGAVQIRRRSLNELELEVETPLPALLVTSEVFSSGWQAELDGARVPILCADAAWRAVAVPPGKHHLRFRFRPPSLLWGAGLALAGLGAAALVIAGLGRRQGDG
jgi:hypothetical protein